MAQLELITCLLPPPTNEECASIPLCNDGIADYMGSGLCSTLEMHGSCLPGFMFMDAWAPTASRPLSLHSISSLSGLSDSFKLKAALNLQSECQESITNASSVHNCAEKCYPFTKSCCPGHYCPLGRACMMPCSEIGSFCPSSNELSLQTNDCYPLKIPQFGPTMGCGGAVTEDTICPASHFCPTSHEMHICPVSHFCRAGVTQPTKCSPLMRCPEGTADPPMSYVAVMLLCILSMYLVTVIGYKWIRSFFHWFFERIHGETYAEWFESNQDSKLLQYLGGAQSTDYASVKKSIKAAFVSNEGDVTVEMVDLQNELPPQMSDIIGFEDVSKPMSRVLLNQESVKFPMEIEFNNLTMKLKSNNKIIVNNVSGRLPAGTITAVMGPSGSGKSSFLSALRNQASYAKIKGEIKVNGKTGILNDYADVVGYVPQNDIMSPWLTPREVLEFQADLRLARDRAPLYKKCAVKDVLELLDIFDIRDSKIGDEKKRGISGGQKKRVNIGMELVAQPSILFLDEPTSGLDSTTSSKVMSCLKKIAEQGVTILVVIHQPRFCIFRDFDNLILLGKGGKNVFVGKQEDAIPYFASLGYEMQCNMNPADFLLDVIQGELDQNHTLSYLLLPQMWEAKRLEYGMAEQSNANNIICEYKPRKTASLLRQSVMAMKRGITINTRQRMTILSDVIMIVVAGFIVGWISDTSKIQEVPQLVHGVLLASALCGSMISLRSFGEDKLQFIRYKNVGISSVSYFLGQSIADAPWIVFEPFLLLFLLWPVCCPRGSVLWWFCVLSIGMFVVQGLAQMISVAVDKSTAPLINVVCILCIAFMNGVNPTLKSMYDNSVTALVIDSSFARWQFEALWITELQSWPNVFSTQSTFQQKYFGFDIYNYEKDIMVLTAFGVVFRIITFLILWRK